MMKQNKTIAGQTIKVIALGPNDYREIFITRHTFTAASSRFIVFKRRIMARLAMIGGRGYAGEPEFYWIDREIDRISLRSEHDFCGFLYSDQRFDNRVYCDMTQMRPRPQPQPKRRQRATKKKVATTVNATIPVSDNDNDEPMAADPIDVDKAEQDDFEKYLLDHLYSFADC